MKLFFSFAFVVAGAFFPCSVRAKFFSWSFPRPRQGGVLSDNTEVPVYEACGFTSDVRFATWFGTLYTNSPVLFPKTDAELAAIVTTAADSGCKVRVRGAGHSEDGLVMQKQDENVVVVHLKDYVPDDPAWHGVIDAETPSIKIRTGASLLELISVIRPQGYLLRSFTAGAIFSVGGVYMNPAVCGPIFSESRLASHVLSFRVMGPDGAIKVYSDPNDVKTFTGSMGLLGIVTAAEISIRKDTGMKMSRDSFEIGGNYNRPATRAFFQKYLTECDGTHFFYYVQQDTLDAFNYYFDGADEQFDAASTETYYEAALAAEPDLAYTGGVYRSRPALQSLSYAAGAAAASILPGNKFTARILEWEISSALRETFDAVSQLPVHGFFFKGGIPNYELMTYNIPCSDATCLEEMVKFFEVTRDFFIDLGRTWNQYLPVEWRIFQVAPDEMLLENLEPNRSFMNVEVWTIRLEDRYDFSRYFAALQTMWQTQFPGGGVHIAKQYAFGPVEGVGQQGDVFPFQDDEALDSVFSEQTKSDFVAAMDLHDPDGVFRAGSVCRLLGLTDKKYTPKQFDGDKCKSDAGCFSGCCDLALCAATGKGAGESCSANCECADEGSTCKRSLSSRSLTKTCVT
jgi:hypothetical protein